jgi:hypothetical protein
MMKYIILSLFILAASIASASSPHGHGRRHKDIDPVSSRTTDDSPNPSATLKVPLLSTGTSATVIWASIFAPKKDKQFYDIASNGTASEVQGSNGEEGDACDAAYMAKIMALGLLAGAALVQ